QTCLGHRQPAKRVAPSIGESSGGGTEPRQLTPGLAVREVSVAARSQVAGPLPLPGSPRQNRLGIADKAPVAADGADARPPGLLALQVSTVSALARTWSRPSRSARLTAACAWASHVSRSQRQV